MQAFRIYIFWQSQGWQNGLPGQRQNGRKSKGRRHCEFGKVIKSAESDIGAGQKGSGGSEATMGQCGEAPGKPWAFGGCADSDCSADWERGH